MQLQDLAEYLKGELPSELLVSKVFEEIEAFKRLGKKVSSIPIYMDGEVEPPLRITKEHVVKMCTDYLEERISEAHVEYFCEIIQLSESFLIESKKLEDPIFCLSDTFVNGPITKNDAKSIINWLQRDDDTDFADIFGREP